MKRQFFDLKPGDSLTIGESRVTVQHKTGQRTRFMVESNEPTRRSEPLQQPNTTPPASILKRPGS